jgi:hypothetical protein
MVPSVSVTPIPAKVFGIGIVRKTNAITIVIITTFFLAHPIIPSPGATHP